jgi:hypothetical protein
MKLIPVLPGPEGEADFQVPSPVRTCLSLKIDLKIGRFGVLELNKFGFN